VVKWSCAFLVILLESPFYLTVKDGLSTFPRLLARALGATSILAGLIGFLAVIAGKPTGIELATLPLLVSMLVMPPFLWLGSRAQRTHPSRLQ
jgi:hypothetical protein